VTPKDNVQKRLKADKLYQFLMAGGAVRGALVSGTSLVNTMRSAHDLGILETLTLGHACLGVALLVANLKGNDSLSMQIECSGPIKGLTADAGADGAIRGYLKQVPIPLKKPLEDFNLSPFFGAGFLTITRYLVDAKQPFSGRVELQHGNIGQDLAHYFHTSEQTPTSFSLSIQFDQDGKVIGAGGLFLQAMPGADEEVAGAMQEQVLALPSLGAYLAQGNDPEQLINDSFSLFKPEILDNKPILFLCRCNRKRLQTILMGLPISELDDILENGDFPLETRCHYCSREYNFNKKEIEKIRAGHLATN